MIKKLLLFNFVLAGFFLLNSCGGEDDGGGGDGGNTPATLTSISISSNYDLADINSGRVFVFSVIGHYDNGSTSTLTTNSSIYVNENLIDNNSYIPTETGTYSVYAKHGEFTSEAITVEAIDEGLQSLTLELVSEYETINLNSNDHYEFKVMGAFADGQSVNLTSNASYFINGNEQTENLFTPISEGSVSVYSTYDGLTSNTLNLSAAYLNIFKHSVLIEDHTGTWCGYCPRVSYALDLTRQQTDYMIDVGSHDNDPMDNSYAAQLRDLHAVTGFPTAKVNRTADWSYPENENVNQILNAIQDNSTIGISFSSSMGDTSGTVDLVVLFGESWSNLKYVVYVLKKSQNADQTNYTNFYGGGSTIPNFDHKHILWGGSAIAGTSIPSSNSQNGSTFTTSVNVSYGSLNPSEMEVVVMILNNSGTVVNVVKGNANETVNLDYTS